MILQATTWSTKKIPTRIILGTKLFTGYQPNITAAVSVILGPNYFTSGMQCFDIKADLLPVLKKSCEMHGVTIKLKSGLIITSASAKALDIMGTASQMIILDTTLKVDLGYVAVILGEFY